jgi:hypothetical protein
MAGTWCCCSLLRTLGDIYPRVLSYLYPDISFIASDAWSQYFPLPIVFCVDAPKTRIYSTKFKITSDPIFGAIVQKRYEGPIPRLHVSGQFFVLALSVCELFPNYPVPPHILWGDVAWCPTSRTVHICPRPSLGFTMLYFRVFSVL